MNFFRSNLDETTVKNICTTVREKFLDIVTDFDYSVFKHFKPEDQTSIKQINIDYKDKTITLSRLLTFDYYHNYYNTDFNNYTYNMKKIGLTIKVKIINNKVYSVIMDLGYDNSSSVANVFSLHVGDEKYLINQTFYNKDEFESFVFQQSTVDNDHTFGLDYVLEIIQKLKV